MKTTQPPIKPAPGYLLTTPYIEEKTTFQSVKEQDGLDQRSEVLAVGDAVLDSEGIMREAPCKKGDIIFHAYNNSEIELSFTKYRFVHFTQVHGTLTQ